VSNLVKRLSEFVKFSVQSMSQHLIYRWRELLSGLGDVALRSKKTWHEQNRRPALYYRAAYNERLFKATRCHVNWLPVSHIHMLISWKWCKIGYYTISTDWQTASAEFCVYARGLSIETNVVNIYWF